MRDTHAAPADVFAAILILVMLPLQGGSATQGTDTPHIRGLQLVSPADDLRGMPAAVHLALEHPVGAPVRCSGWLLMAYVIPACSLALTDGGLARTLAEIRSDQYLRYYATCVMWEHEQQFRSRKRSAPKPAVSAPRRSCNLIEGYRLSLGIWADCRRC